MKRRFWNHLKQFESVISLIVFGKAIFGLRKKGFRDISAAADRQTGAILLNTG